MPLAEHRLRLLFLAGSAIAVVVVLVIVAWPRAEEAGAVGANAMRPGFDANSFPANDDGSTGLVPIGFAADFFGTTYSALFINNNGNLTFDGPLAVYSPFPLTSTGSVIIAPFFADVDTRAGNVVTYGSGTVDGRPAFGVNWPGVGCYNTNISVLNYFQVLLIDRSDIAAGDFDFEFNYDQIEWESGSASGGDAVCQGGASARAGYSNGSGAPGTYFELAGSGIAGSFLDSNMSTGLIHNSLNSSILGRYVFRVRSGIVEPTPTSTPCPGSCPTTTVTRTPTITATLTAMPTPTPCPPGVCPEMSLNATGSGVQCDDPTEPAKCAVPSGGVFDLEVSVAAYPPDPDGPPLGKPCVAQCGEAGYAAMVSELDWTGTALVYKPQPNAVEVPWPDRANVITNPAVLSPTRISHGDLSADFGNTPSTFAGVVVRLRFTCGPGNSENAVSLVPYEEGLAPLGANLTDVLGSIFPTSDMLTINCLAGPTATPTATMPPIPRMQKLPALQNLFLTRQGSKIPPLTCLDSTDVATLTEAISIPISGVDPKDPSQPRQLGGFSFQVKYDPQKVCVTLQPGPAWTQHAQQVCTVEDAATAPALQGVARINCVTLGKATVVYTNNPAGRVLAFIEVRPQPEEYSQIKPNQDNGNAVQINNELCKLTDPRATPSPSSPARTPT
jgi:hypothetical protein